MPHRYLEIDVFTDRPFYGNAPAVIGAADNLSNDHMRRIAHGTNCSETIFLPTPSRA